MLLMVLFLLGGFPGPISGDFDHDGRQDVASIELEGRDVYFLNVRRGAAPDSPVRLFLGFSYPDKLTIAPREQSEVTVCAKGLGPGNRPCAPAKVTIRKGDLLLTRSEASQALMIWDGQAFRLEWISD